VTGDDTLTVKLLVPDGAAPWNLAGGFPAGEFTVHAPAAGTTESMRWTGLANSDWHNPANWVARVTAGSGRTLEMPVAWPPSRCMDVVISSLSPYWPELTDTAYCAGITLEDRAVQGSGESYAALHYDRLAAGPEYRNGEDVRALFHDAGPLAVYVLTPLGEPLAISADGDCESHVTPLGLRLTRSGEVTLEFSDLERFGHNVYLIDREKNLETDLQQTPSYTFTAIRPSVVPALELNSRFALRMVYTGTGLGTAPMPASLASWTVTPQNGEIHVRALSGVIHSLRVYSMTDALVYAAQTAGDYFRISAERGQMYLIRVEVNGAVETKKTFVSD
jgi:hypothetical protein